MKINSIKFKLSALYTAILGIIIVIYTGILYATLSYNLYADFDSRLMDKAEKVESTIDSYLDILGSDQQSFIFSLKRTLNIESQHPEQYKVKDFERFLLKDFYGLNLSSAYVNFLDAEWKPIVRSPNINSSLLSLFLSDKNVTSGKEAVAENIKYENLDLRLVSVQSFTKGGRRYIIQIASSITPIVSFMRTRLYSRLIPIPFILFFGYFIGHVFVSRILRPVAEITAIAEKITHEDLSKRVEAKHVDEEIRSLVKAFNDMISRLAKSFKYIAEFSSHVSHELKTPLAIIRGEMELAQRKGQISEECKKVLNVSLEELGRMLRIIDDLLLLTKLDYRYEFFVFKKFSLIEFLEEIYEQSRLLTSEKCITVAIDMPDKSIDILAEKIHLRRLFFNLIDNAIKFTSSQGKIDIVVRRRDKKAMISISDTGIGIKEDDVPKIFNKFFSQHPKTHSGTHGSGLGLSIVQSIAKIHKGNVEVKSQLGKGTTFIVTLPLT